MKCRARFLTHRYQQDFRLNWSVTVTLALHSPTHQTPLFDPRRLQCAAVDTLDINNADGSQGVMSYSLIEQCGDFQMARREMWQRATFSQSMTGQTLGRRTVRQRVAGGCPRLELNACCHTKQPKRQESHPLPDVPQHLQQCHELRCMRGHLVLPQVAIQRTVSCRRPG